MTERKVIQDKFHKKVLEIQQLEDKLKSARVYLQALQDILKALDRQDAPGSSETNLRPGSALSQARDVIIHRGDPVHINDLLEALGKSASREARASLTSSVAAYVRRREIFTRTAPNTFGLIELGHHNTPVEHVEPPSDFGQIKETDE